jgi:hypothetical protein
MKKPLSRPNSFLALFATFLVVGGVVFVAVLASPKIAPESPLPGLVPAPVDAPSATSVRLVLVTSRGATLVAQGASKALSWPDDVKLLGESLSQLEGADALTGERVYLTNGFVRATSSGIHSPDGRRSLHPSPGQADGTDSVEVRLGSERQRFVLRLPNGRGVRGAMPLGWWDDETIAVAGRTTTTLVAYAISLTGEVMPVAVLPDTAEHFSLRDGALWYVTAEPGEGLESPPGPPSSLHRVERSGKDERVADEPERVVTAYVARGHRFGYATDDGTMTVRMGSSDLAYPAGGGTPLLMPDETHLVIRRDNALILKDVITGREDTLLSRIENGTMVFDLPPDTSGA